ncbi:hypothetical protein [Enterococcus mundtii]|uniref:hypothetical protein n=1 Tax=Enterococcus TaxID=1350 RepID=UPI000DFB1D7C|nr:hypothetical protein [Enterococcus mundtii]NBA62768.1 hypothetical protein [Enterococcus mundtii]STD26806.1 Uncharacterised protein [Enterococcus mundtii]
MNNFWRLNKYHISLSLVIFFIMVFSILNEYISNAFLYVTNLGFRQEMNQGQAFINVFDFFWRSLTESVWSFDYSLIFGTNLFQMFIPLVASIGTAIFAQKWQTIYKFEIYHVLNFRNFVYKKILSTATKIALATFFGFFIYYLFCFIALHDSINDTVTRPMFEDIFGSNFYVNHRFLQSFLEGVVRFFWIPFIYTIFGTSISLIVSEAKIYLLAAPLYYYSMSAIGTGMTAFSEDISLYFNPTVIMASGDYYTFNTYLLLLANSIPLFIGIVLIYGRSQNVEL